LEAVAFYLSIFNARIVSRSRLEGPAADADMDLACALVTQ